MKRILIAILALGCASVSMAEGTAYRSTWTATNETAILESTTTVIHTLSQIIVSSASPNGLLLIVNSSFTINASTIALINLAEVGTYDFKDLFVSKGLWYRTTGNSNGVTIIYKR